MSCIASLINLLFINTKQTNRRCFLLSLIPFKEVKVKLQTEKCFFLPVCCHTVAVKLHQPAAISLISWTWLPWQRRCEKGLNLCEISGLSLSADWINRLWIRRFLQLRLKENCDFKSHHVFFCLHLNISSFAFCFQI